MSGQKLISSVISTWPACMLGKQVVLAVTMTMI